MNAEVMPSLREDYKKRTRTRIIAATIMLIRKGGEDSVTMASVAARAGVADRTVYRHFKTRDALLKAAWKRVRELIGTAGLPQNANALIERPIIVFPRFDDQHELVRAYLDSRARRRRRDLSNKRRREAILKSVRDELPGLGENRLRRRAAIVELITSPEAWDLMRRLSGFDGIEAGDAAAEAVMVLLGRSLED